MGTPSARLVRTALDSRTLRWVPCRLPSSMVSAPSSSRPRSRTAPSIAAALRFKPAANPTISSVSVSCMHRQKLGFQKSLRHGWLG